MSISEKFTQCIWNAALYIDEENNSNMAIKIPAGYLKLNPTNCLQLIERLRSFFSAVEWVLKMQFNSGTSLKIIEEIF